MNDFICNTGRCVVVLLFKTLVKFVTPFFSISSYIYNGMGTMLFRIISKIILEIFIASIHNIIDCQL